MRDEGQIQKAIIRANLFNKVQSDEPKPGVNAELAKAWHHYYHGVSDALRWVLEQEDDDPTQRLLVGKRTAT